MIDVVHDWNSKMKIVLLSPMRCHQFDLAAELILQNMPCQVITAYPRWKLKNEKLPPELIHTYPWLMVPKLALEKLIGLPDSMNHLIEIILRKTLDKHTLKFIEHCDVFESLSSFSLSVGQQVQKNGGKFIVHRGSAHVAYQYKLISDERKRWGLEPLPSTHCFMEQELTEYATSDVINTPSLYVKESFIAEGVDPNKVVSIPYSVEPTHFHPVAEPESNCFHVVFAGQISVRKGIPDLLRAFEQFRHPRKKLTLVGIVTSELKKILHKFSLEHVSFVGRQPRNALKAIFSRSHVFVLPSIDDGFGKVITEAMACGCTVICTKNTGAYGFITNNKEGFIVPIRAPLQIASCLQRLADDPILLQTMRANALQMINELRGWKTYTDQFLKLCQSITKAPEEFHDGN